MERFCQVIRVDKQQVGKRGERKIEKKFMELAKALVSYNVKARGSKKTLARHYDTGRHQRCLVS